MEFHPNPMRLNTGKSQEWHNMARDISEKEKIVMILSDPKIYKMSWIMQEDVYKIFQSSLLAIIAYNPYFLLGKDINISVHI